MKLPHAQLESHLEKSLTKKLAPIYLISGDELLLKQDAIQAIRKAAKQAGFNERVRLTTETGFATDQLYTLLYGVPMFAEKRLIELDFRDHSPHKSISNLLQDYAANPSDALILLLDMDKPDAKIQKSAWYIALEKIGVAIPIWPLPREQLPAWIKERAKKYKLSIETDAARLLSDYVEGNLAAAAQMIEKIYLMRPTKAIDKDLVQLLLTDESRFTVFDFVENIIAGDAARALHSLENLKLEGAEPTLLLWAITRELRLMADCATALLQGESYDRLFQKHRVFSRRQSAMRQFLTRFSVQDCRRYLAQATFIDQMIKGALPGHIWDNLQLFCLRLTAKNI